MAAQGQAIRSFITMTRYPGNILVVSAAKSKTVQTVEDLKNSTVGVSDLGSQSHLFLNYVLLRHGLAPSDVTTIATGTHRAAVAALEHGTLDAWSGFDPGAAQYRKRYPVARVLADARLETGVRNIFGVNAYPGSVLYAKADWLQRNPENAARLARAVLKSLHWIQEHSPEQIMENVPPSYFGEDRAVYREALTNAMAMYSPDGMMPPDGPSAARKVLEASLDVARIAPIDLVKTYTNEFVSSH
jgi:NitT/TauT family transport system substrate-binding protein